MQRVSQDLSTFLSRFNLKSHRIAMDQKVGTNYLSGGLLFHVFRVASNVSSISCWRRSWEVPDPKRRFLASIGYANQLERWGAYWLLFWGRKHVLSSVCLLSILDFVSSLQWITSYLLVQPVAQTSLCMSFSDQVSHVRRILSVPSIPDEDCR